MGSLLLRFLSLVAALVLVVSPVQAVLNDDRYDGNIYALYAGNGSLVPPSNTLGESLADGRTAVIVYYLDDSAASKRFAPVVSELQRLWGRRIDLLPLTTDPLQGRESTGADDPAHYWHGVIPQVVVIDPKGRLCSMRTVRSLKSINEGIGLATGLPTPDLPELNQGSFKVNIEVTSG